MVEHCSENFTESRIPKVRIYVSFLFAKFYYDFDLFFTGENKCVVREQNSFLEIMKE